MVYRLRDHTAQIRRSTLLIVLAALSLAMLSLMTAACSSDEATPPPATIIRASGEELPSATPASASETVPVAPTVSGSGTGESYPMPETTAEVPAETPTPIVYPTAE